MLTNIVRHVFRRVRPTNFKVGVRMEDVDSQNWQSIAITSMVKGQGHVVCLTHVGHTTKLPLGIL